MKNYLYLTFLFTTILLATSCGGNRVYDQVRNLPDGGWAINDTLHFEFDIRDSNQAYNMLYNIRYNDEYPFYNIYIKHQLLDSVGNAIPTTKQPQGMDLFTPTTGTPYGRGFSSTYDHSILVLQNFRFPYNGRYNMEVLQYMRQDPLPGVKALGLRIESSEAENN